MPACPASFFKKDSRQAGMTGNGKDFRSAFRGGMTAGLVDVNPVGIVYGALNSVHKSGKSFSLSSSWQAIGRSYDVNIVWTFFLSLCTDESA
jgi:hypothetical protein